MAVVLVVEDEEFIRHNAVELVEGLGYEVVEACSADEAIRILESRTDIEVVFSDVQMPGTMDGLRLLAIIRDRWPPIRLILTSGRALANDAMLPKGSVFLPKPYDKEHLNEALAKAA